MGLAQVQTPMEAPPVQALKSQRILCGAPSLAVEAPTMEQAPSATPIPENGNRRVAVRIQRVQRSQRRNIRASTTRDTWEISSTNANPTLNLIALCGIIATGRRDPGVITTLPSAYVQQARAIQLQINRVSSGETLLSSRWTLRLLRKRKLVCMLWRESRPMRKTRIARHSLVESVEDRFGRSAIIPEMRSVERECALAREATVQQRVNV